ncbi:MAG: hypothetical protein ACRYGA_14380, partial [Janthinobacterium lividum]
MACIEFQFLRMSRVLLASTTNATASGEAAGDGVAAPLAPLLRAAMKKAQVSAERYPGSWTDVGT